MLPPPMSPFTPPDALDKNLPPQKHLGELDNAAARDLENIRNNREKTQDEIRVEREQAAKPPLNQLINLQEIEVREQISTSMASSYMHFVRM